LFVGSNPKVAGPTAQAILASSRYKRKVTIERWWPFCVSATFLKLFKIVRWQQSKGRWSDRAGDPGQLPLQEKGHYRKMVPFLRFWHEEKQPD